MASRKRAWQIGLLTVALVLLLGGGYAYWRISQPIEGTIQATIVEMNPETRTARIEYVHKRTGQVRQIGGRLADDAVILVNGAPATMTDVHEGDTIEVTGAYYVFSEEVLAHRVNVLRAADSERGEESSASPATAPANADVDEPAPAP